jgi:hypothetical protein
MDSCSKCNTRFDDDRSGEDGSCEWSESDSEELSITCEIYMDNEE